MSEEKTRFDRRVDNYLALVLKAQGKYTHVKRKKGLNSPKTADNERKAVVERIKDSLALAGIRSEIRGKYSIRVLL